ncbi:hypothetical protein HK102_001801 [Quaeritorhiza haematococci]|nr:hypothetical protein HK102_001801 [Quaeritorhiza haematococci]
MSTGIARQRLFNSPPVSRTLLIICCLFISHLITATRAAVWPRDSNGNALKGSIETFWVDPQNLWINRGLWQQGRRELRPAVNRVLRLADAAVADQTLYTVTAKPKDQIAPSGDIHDFYSLARYFWPNTTSPNGLPYVRIDGQTNPEIYRLPDSTWLQVVFNDVFNLGLAYFLSGKEVYAETATKRIRDWFLNPETRMNPNLNFCNWVKGTDIGTVTGQLEATTSGGLLDFAKIYLVLDGIGLIANSPAFTQDDYNNIVTWMQQYLSWLQGSPRGSTEGASTNNRGTWYDVQRVAIELFLGQASTAGDIARQSMVQRITTQIMPDGSQPLEQSRPLSWFYSGFNLEAFFVLAHIAQNSLSSVQVFQFQTQDGRSLARAVDYLMPFALSNGTGWPVPNTGGFDPSVVNQLCKDAYVVYRDVKYSNAFEQIQNGKPMSWNVRRLWMPYGAYDTPIYARSGSIGRWENQHAMWTLVVAGVIGVVGSVYVL